MIFMKKLLTAILATLLVITLAGCGSKLQKYDVGNGLVFSLPAGFEQSSEDNFGFILSNENSLQNVSDDEFTKKVMIVMGNRETFEELTGYGLDFKGNVHDYVDYIQKYSPYDVTDVVDKANYSYFEYVTNGYFYRVVGYKSADSFYTVNFVCYDSATEAKANFDSYCDAVKVK